MIRKMRRLISAGASENDIDRMLCLGYGVDRELAIIAELLQPSSDIRGLVVDDRVRDFGFSAKISCSEFRA